MAISSITRDVTRSNPSATALNTVVQTNQMAVYKVVLSNTGRTTDLDAAGVQQVMETMGAPVHIFQWDANGREAILVADGHSTSIDTIATDIGRHFDAAGTPGTIVADSGVYTDGGATGTTTVTKQTDLFGM
tara:strand:+ start:289 stop:684 length:396 start_codon:yes stop_codon:yes gene_type:complete